MNDSIHPRADLQELLINFRVWPNSDPREASVIKYCVPIIPVWIGQSLSFLAPDIATKIGLNSPEEEMDQSLYIIETKANGLSDMLLTWIFPLSGLLMILDHPSWPFLALVGSGVYLYFACLTIFCRYFLQRQGIKAGSAKDVKVAYVFSVIWILSSIAMIVLGFQELTSA